MKVLKKKQQISRKFKTSKISETKNNTNFDKTVQITEKFKKKLQKM